MKNPFKNLFKKEEPKPILQSVKEIITGEKPKHKQDIIVDADVAFREPPSKKIAEIRALFEPVKFDELEFEEDITDFNLSLLSKPAVKKIIEIIREDELNRSKILEGQRAQIHEKLFQPTDFDNGMQTSFVINKDVERELYKKKVEEQVKGKSDAEMIQYFENSLNEMGNFKKATAEEITEFKKKFKKPKKHTEKDTHSCPQEPGPEQYEWLKKQVDIHEKRRADADKELEQYYLMKQIYNQSEQLSPEMQAYLENCHKKENKNE